MRKNQRGFGIVVYVLLTLVVMTSIVGWRSYQHQKSLTLEKAKPASVTVKTNNKVTINSQQNVSAQDYPKPTAPVALRATPAGSGYSLSWEASVSTNVIANYQVFYQDRLIAEPTTNTYQHNLPPPAPGCKPIPLKYYVKAVDTRGDLSDPSASVTVQYGGC